MGYSRSVLKNGAALNTIFSPVFGGRFGPGRTGSEQHSLLKLSLLVLCPSAPGTLAFSYTLLPSTPLSKPSLRAQAMRVDNRTI